ncbi:hypothetical protein NLJ89_g9788 [Agrocybe chaxingu]|uniref:JmjC domain-containing protein n=1 Tax=Agrocybe chaxingu TaxID=84603 RepID=A0A9W8JZX1_9AGAR|nr:hypothetical protein NLJ89_g9788 [Agrocybe chaxingu]
MESSSEKNRMTMRSQMRKHYDCETYTQRPGKGRDARLKQQSVAPPSDLLKHAPAADYDPEDPALLVEDDARIIPFGTNMIMTYDPIYAPVFHTQPDITLNVTETPKRCQGKRVTMLNPLGEPYSFTPSVHPKALKRLQVLLAAVESSYVEARPLHVSQPDKSVFKVLKADDLARMNPTEVQEILRRQHIVTTGGPVQDIRFDKQGLSQIHPLHCVVTVQDQSILTENHNDRLREGTLAQILQCAQNPKGKVLNALQFPKPTDALRGSSYASNVAALEQTFGTSLDWKPDMQIDTGSLSWRLVGLRGAFHGWHIDCDGFGTEVEALVGAKVWIVAHPRDSLYDSKQFASLDTFVRESFDVDGPSTGEWPDDESPWILEAYHASEHCVYTPEHTLCAGGHFYATSTMQDTMFGIVHSLVAERVITNTSHYFSRRLIRRMIDFYHLGLVQEQIDADVPAFQHLPRLDQRESVLDLLTTCALGILSNVLDLRTYLSALETEGQNAGKAALATYTFYDYNAVPFFDRQCNVMARGEAYSILEWLDANYEFDDGLGAPVDVLDVMRSYLLVLCKAIVEYKSQAEKRGMEGAYNCTPELILRQIRGVNNAQSCFQLAPDQELDNTFTVPTLAYTLYYTLRPRAVSRKAKSTNPLKSGVSEADVLFRQGYLNNFSMSGTGWQSRQDPLGPLDDTEDMPPAKRRRLR